MTPALINPADNPLTPEFYRLLWHNFSPTLAPFLLALGVTIALVPPVRSVVRCCASMIACGHSP